MKTKLILGSLLALASAGHAQNTFPTGVGTNVGIGTVSPANRLQVDITGPNDGIVVNQTATSIIGSAGLYLNNNSGHSWGLLSTGPANNVGANHFALYDFTLNQPRFFISGSNGYVGVGTTSPLAKLHAVGTTLGMRGDATNSAIAYAIQGFAYGVSGSGQSIGISGYAANGAQNFGGYFTSLASGNSIAVYGGISGSSGSGDWAGYFNGDVHGTSFQTSDRKLKDNIKPLVNALDKITLLNPSTYTFRTDEFKGLSLPKGQQMGLIAQELETVFPELIKEVSTRTEKDEKVEIISVTPGYKSVNYTNLIPLLIAGIQEQQKMIADQTKENADLKSQVSVLQNQMVAVLNNKTGAATGIMQLNADSEKAVMEQNVPNPFNGETTIKYTLPAHVNIASMVVYDLSGKQIVSFPITEKGSSVIKITSETLAAGIYIYSILADGKIIDSKRMIVAEK